MKKKSFAKVNIFLKITGKQNNYHLIASRFVKVDNLFDTISFKKTYPLKFTLEGEFGCLLEQNTIYKAYLELLKIDPNIKNFFNEYKVCVDKKIPYFAGLGGGSSNAATFILMVNQYCNLNLPKQKLAQIGLKVGADVPFFIYEYNSANVSGIGEIVEIFDEEPLKLEIFTPQNIKCNTGEIFKLFSTQYYKEASKETIQKLFNMNSKDILNNYSIEFLNDLYNPAKHLYQNLTMPKGWFFSGSGSSFFNIYSFK